ncbi:AbrB/MazE/SpoVT family DNA-binding domain-containing protein [Microseira sp. BLCC-F43]|uniref:AbrB/MazE/SpoVT family DNA-binding domain-containing protein n=1 Tax=Microseira sp. BLCC-F43 TaxID=3153602 RepID=UPI0035B9BF9D
MQTLQTLQPCHKFHPLNSQNNTHLKSGRLTLPESVLQQLDLKQGSRLILIVGEDGTLHLMSLREQVRKLRGVLKNISPNRSLVDELIQERREEAAKSGFFVKTGNMSVSYM